MAIATGAKLGPYEVIGALGEGGMGEVYRARDARIGRDVAIKVLPASVAADTDRLRRFEAEARTAGSLNHANLVTLFDVGTYEGSPYLVMELLDGETLRDKLAGKPLPAKRAAEIARGIAEGLSAAHDRGVIHRDLKPENLFLTRDGRVKILDFGLAKLLRGPELSAPASDVQPTEVAAPPPVATDAGVVLGSVGYMSPEQVRGQPLDARSDLFALGVILWEMLTGSRPFTGPSAVEAMHAIANDEPPDLDPALKVSPILERIVRTCLAKEPAGRFHSAHDLAFALDTLSSASHPMVLAAPPNRRTVWRWAALAAVVILGVGVAIGVGVGRWTHAPAPSTLPSFRRLTFGRGTIDGARFVPGSHDIVYSARWQGNPSTVYMLREGSVEPRQLEAPGALLLATSADGRAAVMNAPVLNTGMLEGVVSVLPLAGGGSREISRIAFAADFTEDGSSICLVTRGGVSSFQLEWPQGEVVAKPSADPLLFPRVRDGRVAYFEGTGNTVTGGDIRVLERGKPPRTLTRCTGCTSLAWGPGAQEIWFSSFDGGESRLEAVSLSGRRRLLARHPGRLDLADVDASGRALAVASSQAMQAFGRGPGVDREVDLTWLDAQTPTAIRADGRQVVLARSGDWEMLSHVSLYLRPLDNGPATNLGFGSLAAALSADGQWVATMEADAKGQVGLRLIPTGAGVARWYPLTGSAAIADGVWFHPSGRAVYLGEETTGTVTRIDLTTGSLTPVIVSRRVGYTMGEEPLSPDGRRILLTDSADAAGDERPFHFLVFDGDGSNPVPAKGNLRSEVAAGWTEDSTEVYLYDRNAIPATVVRWNPITGKRRPFLQITPADPSGIWGISHLVITPSGHAYAYSVNRKLSDLYLIEGLK